MRPQPSTTKRVILYHWDRQPEEGIVNPASYLREQHLEWLTTDGRVQIAPLAACKALCFVAPGAKPDLFTENNVFERRPRLPGLWARLTFRDGTLLEGVLPPNLLEWPADGYLLTPPQPRAGRQRVFVPRISLIRTELRGVIGGASVTLDTSIQPNAKKDLDQLTMFE